MDDDFTVKQLMDFACENLQHASECTDLLAKMAHLKTAERRIDKVIDIVTRTNVK